MGGWYAGIINSDIDIPLKHFGILGQKWGIRRFQNPDGTLTEAGKKRYSNPDNVKKDVLSGIDKTLSRAVEKVNKNLPSINKKYDGINLYENKKLMKQYEKEVMDMATKVHINQLNEEYGAMVDQANLGRKWLESFIPYYLD